ncbi:hypothetical protein BDW62DRAFT_196982 [Aspergillus aurantiobrunneus]
MAQTEEWFGSLADYTALKVLCVRLPGLVEMDDEQQALREMGDLVPCCLEVLCIVGCQEEDFEWLPGHIERMIKNKRVPKLKTLVVDGACELDSSFDEEFGGVRRLCEEADIDLKLWSMEYMQEIWPYPAWNAPDDE